MAHGGPHRGRSGRLGGDHALHRHAVGTRWGPPGADRPPDRGHRDRRRAGELSHHASRDHDLDGAHVAAHRASLPPRAGPSRSRPRRLRTLSLQSGREPRDHPGAPDRPGARRAAAHDHVAGVGAGSARSLHPQSLLQRGQVRGAGGKANGAPAGGTLRDPLGRTPARHRQDRRSRRHPPQAGRSHPRRVRSDEDPSRARRTHHLRHPRSGSGDEDRAPPPRDVERAGLPGRDREPRHSRGRPHHRGQRHLPLDGGGSPLPRRAAIGPGLPRAATGGGRATRPRRGGGAAHHDPAGDGDLRQPAHGELRRASPPGEEAETSEAA